MICIRNATENDAAFIASTEQKVFSEPWSKLSIEYAIKDNDTCFVIAEYDGITAGYISGKNIAGEMYLNNVAVSEKYRCKGIGNALVRYLCDCAENECCELITLEVRESNAEAINLYRRNGFVEVGVRNGFYSSPTENALILTKYFNG